MAKTTRRNPSTPPAVTAEAAEAQTPATPSKLGQVIALLRRDQGATIADLTAVTGWQAHSVRGAIAGAIKKKLGLAVVSEKIQGVRTYRIAQAQS